MRLSTLKERSLVTRDEVYTQFRVNQDDQWRKDSWTFELGLGEIFIGLEGWRVIANKNMLKSM